MRIKEVNGIVNDLIHLEEDFNPMNYIWIKNKFEINLLTGKKTYSKKDTLTDFTIKKETGLLKGLKN